MERFDKLLNRFESLLNRFEGVEGAPTAQFKEEAKEIIKEAASASKTAGPGVPDIIRSLDKEVLVNLDKWKQLAEATKVPHLQLVTQTASEAFTLTRTIVHALAISKSADAKKIAEVIGKQLGAQMKKSGDLINKEIKYKNHAKCISDGLSLLQWYLQGDQIEYAKEQTAQIDFFGNKVLMENNAECNEWYKCFRHQLCGKLFQWIKEKFEQGNPFDNKGDEFAVNFEKLSAGAAPAQPAAEQKAPQPKEEAKKVEAPKPKEATKREPKTTKNDKVVDCSYYVGQTLKFEGDDVKMSLAFNLTRSENTNLIINGKVKGMQIEGCKNCAVIVEEVVTAIELLNCEGVKIQIIKKANQVIIDKTSQTTLYLSEEGKGIKVLTTNSKTTVISFPAKEVDDNGNDSRQIPVVETWQTVIKDDKLVFTPYEAIE